MKIQQNQLWQKGEEYIRVVHRDRLSVVYKIIKDPTARGGEQKNATKKEFCRMLKGAVLLPGTPKPADPQEDEESDILEFDLDGSLQPDLPEEPTSPNAPPAL
jgi:hypothetical protein